MILTGAPGGPVGPGMPLKPGGPYLSKSKIFFKSANIALKNSISPFSPSIEPVLTYSVSLFSRSSRESDRPSLPLKGQNSITLFISTDIQFCNNTLWGFGFLTSSPMRPGGPGAPSAPASPCGGRKKLLLPSIAFHRDNKNSLTYLLSRLSILSRITKQTFVSLKATSSCINTSAKNVMFLTAFICLLVK